MSELESSVRDPQYIIDLSINTSEGTQIFLGRSDQVIRVDNISSTTANKLKADSEGNTWFAREFDYGSDSVRMNELEDVPKRIFQLNIGYQTVMDSGVSNGYFDVVSRITSDPIWKILYRRIGMEEMIHAESYSYALSQIFGSKAKEFLDIIYSDPFIITRMSEEIDAFYEVSQMYDDPSVSRDSDEIKRAVIKMLVQTYLLEGIKFPFSFFVTFTINKSFKNPIQGITRLLKTIAHDEFTIHIPTNLHALKVLRNDQSQGFSHLFEGEWFNELVTSTTELLVNQEILWLQYLLRDGTIPGLNQAIGEHFIKYFADFRLKGIKVPGLYPDVKENDLIQWYNSYKDIDKSVTAGQEADSLGYIKGGLLDDLGNEKWEY